MTPERAKIMSDFFCKNMQNEYTTTRRVLAALPDHQHGWQSHEKGFTAGALAWHIATADCYFLQGILEGEFSKPAKMGRPPTTAGIVEYYEKTMPALLERAQSLTGEQAAKELTFVTWTNPAVIFMNFSTQHTIHHRGQLSAYLRAMGAKVPSIYGPSGDEK